MLLHAFSVHVSLLSRTARLIDNLPDATAAALFSLPENVEGAVQETQSALVIHTAARKLAVESSSLTKLHGNVW